MSSSRSRSSHDQAPPPPGPPVRHHAHPGPSPPSGGAAATSPRDRDRRGPRPGARRVRLVQHTGGIHRFVTARLRGDRFEPRLGHRHGQRLRGSLAQGGVHHAGHAVRGGARRHERRVQLRPSSGLATQISQGAPADVFASASTKNMDQVVAAGAARSPTTFARNVMEVAVPRREPGWCHRPVRPCQAGGEGGPVPVGGAPASTAEKVLANAQAEGDPGDPGG